jgi:sarcosine oxidase delta subunit
VVARLTLVREHTRRRREQEWRGAGEGSESRAVGEASVSDETEDETTRMKVNNERGRAETKWKGGVESGRGRWMVAVCEVLAREGRKG